MFIFLLNFEVKSCDILFEGPKVGTGHSAELVSNYSGNSCGQLPVMFSTSLVLFKCLAVLVKAQKGEMVALASLYRVRNGGTTDNKTLCFHTGKCLESLELFHKRCFVFVCHIGTKLE